MYIILIYYYYILILIFILHKLLINIKTIFLKIVFAVLLFNIKKVKKAKSWTISFRQLLQHKHFILQYNFNNNIVENNIILIIKSIIKL